MGTSDDTRTVMELFAAALAGDEEDEVAWDAVHVLRRRGTQEVFEMAKAYCDSPQEKERARGLDVLAQLGAGKPEHERYLPDCVSLAVDALQDSSPAVVRSAAWALCHLGTSAGVEALVKLTKHPDQAVRHAVSASIAVSECETGIAALIELAEDVDDEVRDWATFTLGCQCDEDTPEIREALRRRLNDRHEDARQEGIWGLAKRRDREGLELLLARLASDEWVSGDQSTAEDLLGLYDHPPIKDLCAGLRALIDRPTSSLSTFPAPA